MNVPGEFKRTERLMGSVFELIAVHTDRATANQLLNEGISEIKRIERLLSEFLPDSVTSQINRLQANRKLEIPAEVYSLLARCRHISKISDGAFDITVSPLKKLFNFRQEHFTLPDEKQIQETLQHVGWQKLLLLGDNTVMKTDSGIRISFAAIGKGYAADMVKKLWQKNGVEAGVVNASGDLTVWGKRADGTDWPVSIANPDNRNEALLWLPLQNNCIATSGDGEQFFFHNGQRFSHNIHPRTGKPLSGIRSVSVAGPSAELCDALCTVVYVMGVRDGLRFIDQLPDTHAIIFDNQLQAHFSSQFIFQHETA